MEAGPAWAAALEAAPFAEYVRQSIWLYPALNTAHLAGLILVVGGLALLDLRLLGFARALPVAALSRVLTRAAIAGLVVQATTGFLLFAADAAALAVSAIFQAKLVLIAIALANALLFRLLWTRALPAWDTAPPPLGRAQAALSIAAWLSVGAAGRLIAYF
jgi:hypothetical protein